jgi:hypothetical protein
MLQDANRAHERRPVKSRMSKRPPIPLVVEVADDKLEYSDPDIDEGDDVPVAQSASCSLLDPLSEAVFRTAVHEEESVTISCAQFLAVQTEIVPRHREVAVKWLIQLNYRFAFSSDAIYNAVVLFDLVSMRIPIQKPEIQVYATVCYCLAVKIDARTRPSIDELNSVTGQSLTNAQLFRKEIEIIRILGFKLSYATIRLYVRIFLDALKPGESVTALVNFLSEIALMKFQFLDFRHSTVALAAFVLGSSGIGFLDVAANAIRICHCENPTEFVRCVDLLRTEGETLAKNWNGPMDQQFLDLLVSFNWRQDMKPLLSSSELFKKDDPVFTS